MLGFLFLSRESIWLDEAFSIKLASSRWSVLWEQISHSQVNGSVYYALLHLWLGLGRSVVAVRSLSVVFAAAAIPPFYAIAKRLFGNPAAGISSLLLTTDAFFVYYAQEARSYSLALLLVVLASYCFIRWLERPSLYWTAAYATTAAAAVYAHLFALSVLAAHACALPARPRSSLSFRAVAKLYALVLILLTPLILYLGSGYTAQLWWLSRPSLRVVGRTLAELAGGGASPNALGILLLLCYAAGGVLFLLRARRELQAGTSQRGFSYLFVLAWFVLPTLGSFLGSFWKPMFLDRYLIVALPALALIAGAGFASLPGRGIRLPTVGAVVALSLVGVGIQYEQQTKEDWRDTVNYVYGRARGGDGVIFYAPYVRMPFEYYAGRDARKRLVPVYPAARWGGLNLTTDLSRPPDIASLNNQLRRYDRVWLILSHEALSHESAATTRELSQLLARCHSSTSESFRGPISVSLYTKKTSCRSAA